MIRVNTINSKLYNKLKLATTYDQFFMLCPRTDIKRFDILSFNPTEANMECREPNGRNIENNEQNETFM